jgi:hypothetical protein
MKTDPASQLPECHEGREAAKRFDSMMGKLLSVPHAEIVRREQEYRKQVEANPNRRGPKRKRK